MLTAKQCHRRYGPNIPPLGLRSHYSSPANIERIRHNKIERKEGREGGKVTIERR